MGELILNLIFYAFQGIGFLVGKWILPRISGGRLVILPLNEPVGPIWSWKHLPDGQLGIEPIFFSMLFTMFVSIAAVVALCLDGHRTGSQFINQEIVWNT